MLWNGDDLTLIVDALREALDSARQGATAEVLSATTSSTHPVLRAIMRYAPKDAGQLAGYLGFLLALAQAIRSESVSTVTNVNNIAVPISIELVLTDKVEKDDLPRSAPKAHPASTDESAPSSE